MAFEGKFDTAFVAYGLAQVVAVVGIAEVAGEFGQHCGVAGHGTGTGTHLFQGPFCAGDIFAAFEGSFGIEQQAVGGADKAVVHRRACGMAQCGESAVFPITYLAVVVGIAEIVHFHLFAVALVGHAYGEVASRVA